MKKVLLGSVLLIALASCGPDGAEENTTHKGASGAGTVEAVDTSASSNQSGATGNGGIGTGASNQTGEENSGTGAEGGSGSATSGSSSAGRKAGN